MIGLVKEGGSGESVRVLESGLDKMLSQTSCNVEFVRTIGFDKCIDNHLGQGWASLRRGFFEFVDLADKVKVFLAVLRHQKLLEFRSGQGEFSNTCRLTLNVVLS